MSLEQSLTTVRQFQSETDAIREAKDPLVTRVTIYVLTGFMVALVALMVLTKLDRIVSSQGVKIVPVGQVSVLQALDPSIIKTIDVHEGDQVKAGQLLATLDSTLTSADVNQFKLQMASLEAQVARAEAEPKIPTRIFRNMPLCKRRCSTSGRRNMPPRSTASTPR